MRDVTRLKLVKQIVDRKRTMIYERSYHRQSTHGHFKFVCIDCIASDDLLMQTAKRVK
jgi:hypothetical protein